MSNEQDDFFDNVLIKLKRKYSKDEVLFAVIKQNSDYEIEIGQLKSEIDFINDSHSKEIQKLKENHKKELSKLKSELKQELNIEIQKEFKESKFRLENIEQKRIISNLRKTISDLISKSNAKNGNEI
jgi:hypothetical protein